MRTILVVVSMVRRHSFDRSSFFANKSACYQTFSWLMAGKLPIGIVFRLGLISYRSQRCQNVELWDRDTSLSLVTERFWGFVSPSLPKIIKTFLLFFSLKTRESTCALFSLVSLYNTPSILQWIYECISLVFHMSDDKNVTCPHGYTSHHDSFDPACRLHSGRLWIIEELKV